MRTPILYIVAGLPGTGKTTISRLLASKAGAAHLRIDTIERALRDVCSTHVTSEGYELAYRVAGDILRSNVGVVADSCNPIDITRRAWEQVALDAAVSCVNIEIVCSDLREHRIRVEQRGSTVPGLRLPTWQEVVAREYHGWTTPRIVVETAGRSPDESLAALLTELAAIWSQPGRPAAVENKGRL